MLSCDHLKSGSYLEYIFAIILCFAAKSATALHLRLTATITKSFPSTDAFTLLRQPLSIIITIAWWETLASEERNFKNRLEILTEDGT